MKTIVLVMAAALALCACTPTQTASATTTVKKIIAVGGDVLECAPSEAAAVQGALLHGGWDWLTAVIDSIGCVQQVVKGIEAPVSGELAERDGGHVAALPRRLTRLQRARIATARVLAELVTARVTP